MTKIEWTEETWNPVAGCSVVSPGCTNCYAMRMAGTRLKHTPLYKGLTQPSKAGPVWTGELRLNAKALTQPLRWRKPRTVFVNSMSDLFHEDMPTTLIDQVFAIMGMAPQHTFQILTKRPKRMRDYCKGLGKHRDVDGPSREAKGLGFDDSLWFYELSSQGWYLPNVWLGTSVEDQRRADERIPVLLDTPAAVRFISAEPLLGSVDISLWLSRNNLIDRAGLDWVIAGGESGVGSRPMHPDWIRSICDQCVYARVPFFFKQWGEWGPSPSYGGPFKSEKRGQIFPTEADPETYYAIPDDIAETKGGLIGNFDRMHRIGKKAAGRLLDREQWSQYPEKGA